MQQPMMQQPMQQPMQQQQQFYPSSSYQSNQPSFGGRQNKGGGFRAAFMNSFANAAAGNGKKKQKQQKKNKDKSYVDEISMLNLCFYLLLVPTYF